ncbi:DUF2634 domain-containing protein [Lysinibacillus sp. CD3-6]|uniref:DUF2634 domain-containing protein n=1 Tax=Lysinibacillus sp. CD3-6 TaxID=2892541 RepID=UPI00111D74A8|nr:DUF2634 domain-containing protein [Lysinibacillus sp. CD3-6]UED81088.1 DUF2634 domain-containing protein [Lysinibacillus sp. CD3-6]
MKTLALLNGDLLFENGDFKLDEGEKEVAQCIGISLGTNLKEWFLNEATGLDFKRVLEKSTKEEARAEVMRVLSQEERIREINSIEIKDVNRVRKIVFSVTLTDGTFLNEEVVLGGIR